MVKCYMNKKEYLIAEWIKKAENDLAMAKLAIDNQPELRDLICFHCQQTAEKYLKAYLVYLGIIFKKTHSLDYLIDLISDVEEVSDDLYEHAEVLDGYGVEIRYPMDWEPTNGDVDEAYNAAIAIKKIIIIKSNFQ